ncbi:MAG: ligase-associated DNA damage response exonuclease [Bacteroidota bacterium]|nr:ligase-associated DNA damage response exonuclease [Bacteroidota bacterium]
MALIEFSDKGLFCPQGNFYIDPWKPVQKAVITHAHSDHARWGSQTYLCHHHTKPLLQLRLGDHNYQSAEWNEPVNINGVRVSLHPAGHVIGSSQVRVEYKGEVWVVSGDYKTENDGLSGAFEPVTCHTFITESTFGLPIYNWQPQENIYKQIQEWIKRNQQENIASVLIAYSLGKAQRVLQAVEKITKNIFVHGAIWNTQEVLQKAGWNLPAIKRVTNETPKQELKNAVVIAPPSAADSSWLKKFSPYRLAICSGWMQVRGNNRRSNADAGFVLSDHADWKGLLSSIKATDASTIFITHGFQSVLARYLTEQGFEAAEVKTEYGNDDDIENASNETT